MDSSLESQVELTENFFSKKSQKIIKTMQVFVKGTQNLSNISVENEAEFFKFIQSSENNAESCYFTVNGQPIESFDQLTEGCTVEVNVKLLGGKVHGSLARAGKVKGQTPNVEPEDKRKPKTGRAKRRLQYNRRFVTESNAIGGKRKGPNTQMK